MNNPNLFPTLVMPKIHGKDRRCDVCGWPFRRGEAAWGFDGLLACRGDSHFCKIRLAWKASQLLVDAEELIQL